MDKIKRAWALTRQKRMITRFRKRHRDATDSGTEIAAHFTEEQRT